MKVRKSIAALLLSALLVLTFLPVGAFAEEDANSSPATTLDAGTASAELASDQNLSALIPNWKLEIQDESGHVKADSSYSAYKIISYEANYSNSSHKFVYTNMALIPAYKTTIINAVPGLTAASSDSDIELAISNLKADGIASLAVALKGAVGSKADKTADKGVFKFSPSDFGYYLVLETDNASNDGTVISKPILVNVPNTQVYCGPCGWTQFVKVKTSKASITKKIVEKDSQGNTILVDSSTAALGDTIDYQSLSDIPTYSSDSTGITYYVTDTFSAGLTFIPKSVAVNIIDASNIKTPLQSTDYDLVTDNLNGATFRITLKDDKKIKEWGKDGSKLLVTYSATLNDNANTGNTGNPNSINLTYSNKPGQSDSIRKTPDDTVITYTSKLVITKVDGTTSNAAKLKGAVFELYKTAEPNTVIQDVTTDSNGTATITKLQQGSYTLKEKTAPDGYNLLGSPITFTVKAINHKDKDYDIPDVNFTVDQSGNTDAANLVPATWSCDNKDIGTDKYGVMNIKVVNTPNFNLPGTGGIGTTIFFVSGAAILVLGGCMAVVYIRRKKKSTQHFQR